VPLVRAPRGVRERIGPVSKGLCPTPRSASDSASSTVSVPLVLVHTSNVKLSPTFRPRRRATRNGYRGTVLTGNSGGRSQAEGDQVRSE